MTDRMFFVQLSFNPPLRKEHSSFFEEHTHTYKLDRLGKTG